MAGVQRTLLCRWLGCERAFDEDPDGARELKKHLKKDHREGGKSSKGVCRWEGCKNKTTHGTHLNEHLPEWYEGFACKECGEMFSTRYTRSKHVKDVHNGDLSVASALDLSRVTEAENDLVSDVDREEIILAVLPPPASICGDSEADSAPATPDLVDDAPSVALPASLQEAIVAVVLAETRDSETRMVDKVWAKVRADMRAEGSELRAELLKELRADLLEELRNDLLEEVRAELLAELCANDEQNGANGRNVWLGILFLTVIAILVLVLPQRAGMSLPAAEELMLD